MSDDYFLYQRERLARIEVENELKALKKNTQKEIDDNKKIQGRAQNIITERSRELLLQMAMANSAAKATVERIQTAIANQYPELQKPIENIVADTKQECSTENHIAHQRKLTDKAIGVIVEEAELFRNEEEFQLSREKTLAKGRARGMDMS